MANYCTSADLSVSLGGSAVMVQLLDKNGDGVADADQIAACLARATAEMKGAIQIAIDLDSLDAMASYPDELVYRTTDVAVYRAWLQGGEGQTMPESVRVNYENAARWMDQVAKRERTLGVIPKPATSQQAEQVNQNPAGVQPRTPTRLSTVGAFW